MELPFTFDKLSAITLVVSGIVFYQICLGIYRLYFHPLAKFPGPFLARASYAYMFYHDIVKQGCMFVGHIDDLHEQYGPIVRICPDEIHICDPDFSIEVRRKKLLKPPGWNPSINESLLGAATHERHRMLRMSQSPFFAQRNILAKENIITAKMDRLFQRLVEAHTENTVVTVGVCFTALTMDLICKFAFDIEYGSLDSRDYNVAVKEAFTGSLRAFSTSAMFPWLPRTMQALPQSWVKILNPRMAPLMEWSRTVNIIVNDFLSAGAEGKRKEGTIFQAILDSDLPPEEKTVERLHQEGGLVVGAGTESTSRALSVLTFFVYSDPARLKRLREEIGTVPRQADGFFSLTDLEKLPYLSAFIDESLRIQTSGGSRKQRRYPEPLEVQGWTIPANETFCDNMHDRHINPKIFVQPHEFIPERWLDGEKYDISRQRHYYGPFERGTRNCIGQNLALAEIYLVLAHMIMKFDLELYDTTYEKDIRIVREYFMGVPSQESKGIRVKIAKILHE